MSSRNDTKKLGDGDGKVHVGRYQSVMGRFSEPAVGGHIAPHVAAGIANARRKKAKLALAARFAGKSAQEIEVLVDEAIDLEDKTAQANFVAWKRKASAPQPVSRVKLDTRIINAIVDKVIAEKGPHSSVGFRPFGSFEEAEAAMQWADEKQAASARKRTTPRNY